MRVKTKISLSALIGLLFLGSASASTYKWVDEYGNTHYGQTPPPGVQAQQITPVKASSSAADEIKAIHEKKRQKAESLQAEQERTQQQKLQEERDRVWKANCLAANTKLKSLDRERVRKTDAQGQRALMSDVEIEAQRLKAKQEVELFCNPPKFDESSIQAPPSAP